MSRWVIALALTWSAWAVQQPAVALARPLLTTFPSLSSELGPAMCGEGAQTLSLDDLPLGRAISLGPLPATSELAEERGTAKTLGSEDDAPPAWCVSPDDPRCAPRDQSAPLDGPRAHVSMQYVTAMRWPAIAADSGSRCLRPQQLGAPRSGVGLQLERPPRV